MKSPTRSCRRLPALLALLAVVGIAFAPPASGQPSLREKIGQMLMVSFTGDSLEKSSASLDTLKLDLAGRRIGGVILFTWSNNLRNRGQILHLTSELRRLSPVPLLIATDQEGGRVARLGPSNGFAATPTALELGSITKSEAATRSTAATMAGWLDSMGINLNLAPVADVNVNPSSPAIGALERSYSRIPDSVAMHAGWFVEEMHRKGVGTTLKHFPGHGSATTDSHLGLPDITATWSREELRPFATLVARGVVDAVMTGHLFNRTLDSTYPATLSRETVHGLLRDTIGFQGVVISDEMSMRAITDNYGLDEAAVLAVNAGVDILLYNRNLLTGGEGLARHLVDLIEAKVMQGVIPWQRIDQCYARIQTMKSRYATPVAEHPPGDVPQFPYLAAYPNPFNASTTVVIRLAGPAEVSVEVFDILGRSVASLFDGPLGPGETRLRWDAGSMSSGTYFLRLDGAGKPVVARMLLIR